MDEYKKIVKHTYGGYMLDNEILSCSSGGVATELSRQVINDGGYVAGVRYSNDYKSSYYCITNKLNELEYFKGSKYIVTDNLNIFEKIKYLLESDKTVLFIGLPCIMGALKKFLKITYNNLILCELICHGPIDSKYQKEYVEKLEKKFKSKVCFFSVRYKKNMWQPAYLYAKFENGKEFIREFYMTELGFAFSVTGRNACYNCKFKSNNHCGDILIGDYWGVDCNDSVYNPKGVSVLFAQTEKGNELIINNKKIFLETIEPDKAIINNPMIIKSKAIHPQKSLFDEIYREKGLFIASRKCGFKKQFYSYMISKYFSKLFPKFLKDILKKIMNT